MSSNASRIFIPEKDRNVVHEVYLSMLGPGSPVAIAHAPAAQHRVLVQLRCFDMNVLQSLKLKLHDLCGRLRNKLGRLYILAEGTLLTTVDCCTHKLMRV